MIPNPISGVRHQANLHNAWETILDTFYYMEYKMIKKLRQDKVWIEVDIPYISLIPNWYNALAPANSLCQRLCHNPSQLHDVT